MVGPYPPARDGIAHYAAQLAACLRREGHRVTVVSPQPSAAHYCADFHSTLGVLRILRLSRGSDETVVQFQPDFFIRGTGRWAFALQMVRLGLLFRLGQGVRVYVHEAWYEAARRGGRRALLWRYVWRQPQALLVHSERERRDMIDVFGVDARRVRAVQQEAVMARRTAGNRDAARARLGIPADDFLFLCIGFIQPHKGFDRAVRCFQMLAPDSRLRLDIVGSVRVETPEHDDYLRLLKRLAMETDRVTVHEGYVDSATFDSWIVASDVILLPYRDIWSSGVIGRSALYDVRCIITDVGGLPDQARPSTVIAHDERGFAVAMAQAAGVQVAERTSIVDSELDPRQRAMETVRARAARLRDWYAPSFGARPSSDHERHEFTAMSLAVPPRSLNPRALALRAVYRVTRWELQPIVDRLNQVQHEYASNKHGKRHQP